MNINKVERNYGIDLLKITCLLGVVILHILGHGGILNSTKTTLAFSLAWLLEILVYPSVNCFVIISGFVGFRGEKYYPRIKNLISLYFVVLFYSIVIGLFFKVFVSGSLSAIEEIIKLFFPVTTTQYWFFTAYFAMFIVSPALNLFVHKADSRMLKLLLGVTLFLAVLSCVRDPFYLNAGFSFAWFCQLYIIGATIRKHNIAEKFSKHFWGLTVIVALLITWIPKILSRLVGTNIGEVLFARIGGMLISYCSPTIIIMAIGFVCIFEGIKIREFIKTIIRFLVPATFSVYLLHENYYIRELFIGERFVFANNYHPFLIVLIVVLSALAIFLACVVIDKIRALLFKILHIDKLAVRIERVIKVIIGRILI